MKPKIHPDFIKMSVTCACGYSFESMSTAKELRVEVCSACHPFFTGTQRFVDTAGRVERFQAKVDAQKKAAAEKTVKTKVKAKAVKAEVAEPKADVVASEK
jgi:large subunit ribosomal protein L31